MQIYQFPEITAQYVVDGDWLILQTSDGHLTKKISLSELFKDRGGGMTSRIRDDSAPFTPANNDRVVLTVSANYSIPLPPAPYAGYFFSVIPTNASASKKIRIGSANFRFQSATQSVYLKDPYQETGFLYVDPATGWIATRQDTLTLAGSDPLWNSVRLLIPGEGTNGESVFTEAKNNLVITEVGNVTTSTAQSKWGQGSIYFDGSGGYLRVAPQTGFAASQLDLPGDFALEMWIYRVAHGAVGTMPCFRDAGEMVSGGFYLDVETNNFWFGQGGTNPLAVSYTFPTNAWKHFAISRSVNTYRAFIDGVKIAENTSSFTVPNTGGGLTIGRSWNGNFNAQFYLNDLRLTVGDPRYTSDFTPPADALPRG